MKEIDKNSEEWRRQCEAKKVLTMNHDRRQEYYRGVKLHRGQKGVDELISDVKEQYKLQQQKEQALEI